ncbi:putative glycoside hydrolase family 95 protein [Rosellinia necatrix]|uniref:Putative glycoside hydrolase family 95 protein n=1 Tax=Rosellinia necatrix TaxID=77044 RepID=A0A1S8AB88_ROSNE|nr:putative glycoside hydrolase family 95 protein [Rosellinia necatrix]
MSSWYISIFPLLLGTGVVALNGSQYLWYNKPATEWERGSLPIGNGRMGATIYGSLQEVITLNEDTIWSGPYQDRTPADGFTALSRARQLLLAGNITGGGNVVFTDMNPPPELKAQRSFSYFGNLNMDFGHSGEPDNYVRWLDTKAGNSAVTYTYDNVNYTREYIASVPADVLAMRFAASTAGSLNLRASITRSSGTVSNIGSVGNGIAGLTFQGSSGQSDDENPILFTGKAWFLADGANMSATGSNIQITSATVIDVFFDVETNYRYPDAKGLDTAINTKLAAAISDGFEKVRDAAIADASALLRRASINLGQSPNGLANLPTDQRVESSRSNGDDVELVTLAWNLGRHMLVASSRNTAADVDFPANLQGVWNNATSAPWGGKYTININTEMNYWPALTTNLLETQEPLYDLMALARPRGEQMARDLYGCNGTVFHHNLDLWGDPAPTDNYRSSSMWPMGAAWLVQHMMEYYRFTNDTGFLERTVYPYLIDVATFYYCYTFEYDGWQVTGPSLSPENTFKVPSGMSTAGNGEPMDINIAMDDQLMRAVVNAIIEAAAALGVPDSDGDVVQAKAFLPLIRPPQIGSLGQILEWRSEYVETGSGHRHFSPLWSLFPDFEFTPMINETLAKAAGILVDRRIRGGGGSTGWSRTWAINLYARLFRGDDAWDMVQGWFAEFPTAGLWNTDKGATFQIDGNFGLTSGLTEMFLQSHAGIHILPALPAAVPTGSVIGLTARGNFIVNVEWEDGRLKAATVTSNSGSELTLRVSNGVDILVDGVAYTDAIQTVKGRTYAVTLA